MDNETRYSWIFCTEDGVVVTLTSNTPFLTFPNKILSVMTESKEAYNTRIKWQLGGNTSDV